MRRHRRALIYAALALAVPLPAFALSGGDGETASLAVSASLDECGITGASVVCKIDASWNDVPGAERYTASVTSPDGSVTDYGSIGGTATSFWVPYVGNGTYTVTISAWGTPPGEEKRVLVAKQRAGTGGRAGNAAADATPATDQASAPATSAPPPSEPATSPEPTQPPPEPAPEPDPTTSTTTTTSSTTTTSTTPSPAASASAGTPAG